ncbi:uncharacterized protein LOC119602061 isoform X2 [Lucilia sericata]|uniref:uncharacterized protein LOC119602061 isoform X2 n=1 Tax=Lucilia sericata TaxID=13632 RepID=UPI0018A8277E|nr:uncharacterized protein LOC119602061 isoform X2 [Lucilia sericata]
MFKLIVLVFAALFAIAAARPGYLASSPVVYSSHYVQPVVSAHYSVPVVHAPVVHSAVVAPVVHAAPVYHSYGAVVKSYAPAYGAWKH